MKVRSAYIVQTLVQHMLSNVLKQPVIVRNTVAPTYDIQRIQAAHDSAEYIHCPNVGPTHAIQRIQAAYDSAEYS